MNKPTYEIISAPYAGAKETIKRTDPDGTEWFIPMDESNSDYQAYLKSLETTTE